MMNVKKRLRVISALVLISVLLGGCAVFRDAEPTDTAARPVSVPAETAGSENTGDSGPDTADEPDSYPYADANISFVAAGDNLIHPNIYESAARRTGEAGKYDFIPMYADAADLISSADFAFINQETLMAGDGFALSGYPAFNSPQELGRDLAALGFDIISMANNHMLDLSAAGLEATVKFWKNMPVTAIGAYENAEDAANIRTVTKDDVVIALLSYTYGTNGIVLPAGSYLDIPYINDERIIREMAAAREISDFIIVSVHWGDEYSTVQNSEQERLAQLFADNGAGVILGHHSHTLQPLRWIERSDGGKTLCIYSLGNLVSSMMYPSNMVGGFLSLSIKGDGKGGLTVTDVSFTPTVFYYSTGFYDTHLYLLEDYNDEIAATHGTQLYGDTTTRAAAESFVRDAIPEEYLPGFMKTK